MTDENAEPRTIFSRLSVGFCWVIICSWFLIWLILLPQRGLSSAIDITNPSLLGIVAFSAGLYLVGSYKLIPSRIATSIALIIVFAGVGLAVNRELSTRPITLKPGEPLIASFRVPEAFQHTVTAFEIDPPVRNRATEHFLMELSCDDQVVGKHTSREQTHGIGWLFRLPDGAMAVTSNSRCTLTVNYDDAVEFFRPTHDWIWVLAERGEIPDYTVDIEAAQVVELDY